MATDAQRVREWPRSLAWLREFLRDELAPYQGRAALVTRMVVAATIVMLINMTFRIPYGAFAAIYALTISRENPEETLQDLKMTVVGFATAVIYVLIGAALFAGEPTLRLVWVLATLFLIFWALSAVASYRAAARFGYLLVVVLPLWDRVIPAEQKVTGTLWAIGSLSLANAITAVVEVVYSHLYHLDNVTAALVERLQCTAALLRSWSAGTPDRAREEQITRLVIVGTSRMRRDLLRSNYPREIVQQTGAIVSLVGRLVDVAANLTHFPPQPSDRVQVERDADRIDALADRLLTGRVWQALEPSAEVATTGNVPLRLEMERTVSLIEEVLSGSGFVDVHHPPIQTVKSRKTIFVPDAFTNSKHVRFAIRGGLSASACYLTYSLIAWPGISTAVTTCFLTALTTVGASRQKQILRVSGAVVGGVILGFGAQIFVLPALDSITGFFMLFVAVTIPAAWIAASGPRLSYFGVQIALAFYLINLEEFRFQTSLAVARDRVFGILLGLLAMWLIFDQLWEGSAATEMKRTFIGTLHLLARLMREPVSPDRHAAAEISYTLRETINSNFDKLRQQADGVMLEFGRDRESHLAVRAKLLDWQIQLRIIFIARIALFKYRMGLPGFELPEPLQEAQQQFDVHFAAKLDAMADRLEGRVSERREDSDYSIEWLQQRALQCCTEDPAQGPAAPLRTFLALSRRIDDLLRSVEREIGWLTA